MTRWLKLLLLRRKMRDNAGHIDWMRESIAFGQIQVAKYEARQQQLQSQLWLLERPGSIISSALAKAPK